MKLKIKSLAKNIISSVCRILRLITDNFMKFNGSLWTGLRSTGNSSIIKSAIFIPLIGYTILFNENIISYLQFSSEYISKSYILSLYIDTNNLPEIEISYRLYFLYYGLSFIGIGSIMYMFFCPQIIKNYESGSTYYRNEHEILTDHEFDKIIIDLVSKDLTKDITDFINYHSSNELYSRNKGYYWSLVHYIFDILISGYTKGQSDPWLNSEERTAPAIPVKNIYISSDFTQKCVFSLYRAHEDELDKTKYNELISKIKKLIRNYKEKSHAHILNKKYTYSNYENFIIRNLIFSIYVLGFILLAIPAIDTFISVFYTLINK